MIGNASSVVQHVIETKNGTIKHVNVSVKIIVSAKKIVVGILANVFVQVLKNYCWYYSDCVWLNYICYGYCINKHQKCYE